MIMPAFNAQKLEHRLVKLDKQHQLAFGAACCERLFPNYVAFEKDVGWDKSSLVRKALDTAWSQIISKSLTEHELRAITSNCEACAPSSDDFTSIYVTAAQDACFAVCSLLDYLLDEDVIQIVAAATFSTDSVDLYIQEIEHLAPNDALLEQKILAHNMMQRELLQQEQDLLFLERTNSLDFESLKSLRELWQNNGKSNLDLP